MIILTLFFSTGLSGLLFYILSGNTVEKIKSPGLHLALGTLAGSVIFHLIPDYFSHPASGAITFLLLFLSGLALMNLLRLSPKKSEPEKTGIVALLLGDSIHNAITSFLWISACMAAGHPLYSLVPAFLMHEIPHKLGNFGIMLFSGLSMFRSLMFSTISASFFFSGIALRFLPSTPDMQLFLPLVSGLLSFTVINGIRKNSGGTQGLSRWGWFFSGLLLMGIVSFLFKEFH